MTTKAKYVAEMGERLGKRFDELWQELAWLNVKWTEHVELFGTKESRIKLLNESASLFFRIVQDTLLEGALLHIARLTERSPFQESDLLFTLFQGWSTSGSGSRCLS